MQRGVLDEVPDQRQEVLPDPLSGELEAVRHLVERHPRPELDRPEAPLLLEPSDVRYHEVQAAGRPWHGEVVLPQDPLPQVSQDGSNLGPEEQRHHLADHHVHQVGRALTFGLDGHLPLRLIHGPRQTSRQRLQEVAESTDVRLHPLASPKRLGVGDVGRAW